MYTLKPQDSFGEFNNLIFSWSSECAGNHQKTPSDLPAIVLNDILWCNIAELQIIIVYITYGKVFGGGGGGDSEHFYVFGYFLKMEAFRSELLTGH